MGFWFHAGFRTAIGAHGTGCHVGRKRRRYGCLAEEATRGRSSWRQIWPGCGRLLARCEVCCWSAEERTILQLLQRIWPYVSILFQAQGCCTRQVARGFSVGGVWHPERATARAEEGKVTTSHPPNNCQSCFSTSQTVVQILRGQKAAQRYQEATYISLVQQIQAMQQHLQVLGYACGAYVGCDPAWNSPQIRGGGFDSAYVDAPYMGDTSASVEPVARSWAHDPYGGYTDVGEFADASKSQGVCVGTTNNFSPTRLDSTRLGGDIKVTWRTGSVRRSYSHITCAVRFSTLS